MVTTSRWSGVLVVCAMALGPAVALGQESDPGATRSQDTTPTGVERRSPGDIVSDAWITAKTMIALFADDRVSGWDVNVNTRNGVVALRGNVNSAEAKRAAENVARGIEGVRDVRNELQVTASSQVSAAQAGDGNLEDRVKAEVDAARLNNADVDVSVDGGVVRLTGEVETISDSALASEQARRVPGVRAVRNELRVKRDERLGGFERSDAMNRPQAAAAIPDAETAIIAVLARQDRIQQAEETLKSRGFDPGPIDGVVDEQTHAAIRQYQKAHGLRNTGRLDIATSTHLGLI